MKQLVDEHWTILEKVQNEQNIELLQQVTPQLRDLAEYTPAEIWQAVQAKTSTKPDESCEPTDLKTPEWEVFSDPESAEKGRDFQLRVAAPPKRYAKYFEKIVLAERLREVRALVGFTRIESPSDYDNPAAFPENQRASLSRTKPTWVPSSETRGEGLFFHFKNDVIEQCRPRFRTEPVSRPESGPNRVAQRSGRVPMEWPVVPHVEVGSSPARGTR